MKTENRTNGIENPAFQNEVLANAKLLRIKGGCDDDDSDCEEQTAVVLDNGSGG